MTDPTKERRTSPRIRPKGTLVLLVGEYVQHGRIKNLGKGGALIHTSGVTPQSILGQGALIELRLDGGLREWMRITGRILRITGNMVAIAFDGVPDDFAQLIDDSATASHAHARVLSVVLLDGTAKRRTVMAEVFRAAGCQVLEVTTPLEAIVRLGESHFEPDLIAVADSLPTSTSDELRRFVEREHPRAKLVTIGDDLVEPSGIAHWLSSADPDSDLAARVRRVILRPSP
jgi:CheY-like chemotaxis protein